MVNRCSLNGVFKNSLFDYSLQFWKCNIVSDTVLEMQEWKAATGKRDKKKKLNKLMNFRNEGNTLLQELNCFFFFFFFFAVVAYMQTVVW